MSKPMTIFGQFVEQDVIPVAHISQVSKDMPVRIASQGLFTIYVYEKYDKYGGFLLLRNTPIVLEHYDAGLPYSHVDRIIGHLEEKAKTLAGEMMKLASGDE